MMKKLLLLLMMLAFALPPALAGEKTITISRNEGIYEDSEGVYYCSKGGITMTFSSGMNNVNYLVEHQQVVFDIFSTNYVIKKIKFNCLDNTTDDNLDCFYWGPSTIHELGQVATYTPTGNYTYTPGGYIGTWVGGSTPSKYIKFVTEAKPVRFGSVEITIDKEFGDIYEKVTDNSQLKADSTYVLVSQYASKALGKEDYYSDSENLMCFTSTPVTLLDNNNRVKVTDEVQLMKLVQSGYSSRPWYIKVGDNYMRRRSSLSGSSSGAANGQGYNLHSASSVSSYEQYFRVSISVSGNTNQNALIRFDHNNSETSGGKTFAIRHYNGGNLFRDMDYSSNNQYASNQRVYLYKPAQVYYVTTDCLPDDNSGYITLDEGVLKDGNGNFTSQQYDNVTFFVGPTEGWGVGTVTVTNLSTNEVTTLTPTATSDFGNNYSFAMPGANVNVTANFLQPYDIHTVINPDGDSGSFEFIDGYTDFNGQPKSNDGKTVTFKPVAADGYSFTSVSGIDDVTGQPLNITLDADGNYSFEMPGNSVTLTANFDLIPYFVITTECKPSDAGRIDVYGGVATVDNAMTAAPGNVVTFWVEHYSDNVIQSVTVTREGVTEPVALNVLDGNEYGRRYSFTMPTGNVHIVATFEPYNGLYLLGTSMGRTNWCPSGPKFSFDATNNEYYLDVYFKGGNDNADVDQAYGYFSFAQTVTNFDWTNRNENSSDWSGVSGRLAATSNNFPVDGNSSEVYLSGDYYETNHYDNAFKIPAGVYRIIVNRAKNQMRIVETPLHLTFDPESGSIVPQGKVVTIDSDLEDVVHGIASSYTMTEDSQKFRNTTDDIEDNPTWVSDDNEGENGAQATINQDGTTVHAEAWIGYIVVPGSATYNFADYDITSICSPNNAGSITVANTAQEGATVTFTVNTNEGYTLSSVVIQNNNDPYAEPIVPTDNGDGTYTFTMPADDVVIVANFSALVYYNIYTIVTPDEEGTVHVQNQASAGETVNFSFEYSQHAIDHDYDIYSVTVTDANGNLVTVTRVSTGNYSFVMPNADVTIAVVLKQPHQVKTEWHPQNGGYVGIVDFSGNTHEQLFFMMDHTVTFIVTPNPGFELTELIVDNGAITPTFNEDEEYYTFVMPDRSLTIKAWFAVIGEYQVNLVNNPDEGGSMTATGHVRIENGNVYSDEDQTVVITPAPSSGWQLVDISAQDENGNPVTLTNNEDGTYSMVMPAADVTVTANYFDGYDISTDYDHQAGVVTLTGIAADAKAFAGETATFSVEVFMPGGDHRYEIDQVYVTIDGTDQVVPVTLTSTNSTKNEYSFTMPEGDVTVHATFKTKYRVNLEWIPYEYGAFRMHVYEQGGHYAGETSHMGGFFLPGTIVYLEVENLWEDADHGNYTIDLCDATYFIYEPNFEAFKVIQPTDQSSFTDLGNHNYRIQFEMPAHDVVARIILRAHTTLKFIESSEFIPDGTPVEVADELIGTWSARGKLWAKDKVESFNKTEKEDGARDYLRNEFPLQKKEWIQNNSVLLNFDGFIYDSFEDQEEEITETELESYYASIEDFVDEYIKEGSIKGTFYCKGMYSTSAIDDTHNHKAAFVIDVDKMPQHVEGYTNSLNSPSLGYPGYIPDPREVPKSEGGYYDDPIMYNYNHYTPSNFCATNIAGRSGLYKDGDMIVGPNALDSLQNKKLFFMNPKDQEIVQVWAVYAGHVDDVTVYPSPRCFPDQALSVSGELFTTYEYLSEDGSTFNRYDLTGYFIVPDFNEDDNDDEFGNGGWKYNRLNESRSAYGKPTMPGSDDIALVTNNAYLFHAAIEEIGYDVVHAPHAPKRAPVAKQVPEDGLKLPFRVYPLDLYSPEDNFTAVREIMPREASEIVSISYYNIMGQESKTPFDGINIEVIRYKDGSMISRKVLR